MVVRGEDGDVRIKKEWGHVVEKYPNNFMRGSDVVGDFHNYHKIIRKYNALLKALAPKTRRNVGHSARCIAGGDLENALRQAYPILAQMHLANVVVD